jgi:hypothetical protein
MDADMLLPKAEEYRKKKPERRVGNHSTIQLWFQFLSLGDQQTLELADGLLHRKEQEPNETTQTETWISSPFCKKEFF